jgi:hypothetical protein
VLQRYVSAAAARTDYGVVVTETCEVDVEGTALERAARQRSPASLDRGFFTYGSLDSTEFAHDFHP